MLLMNDDEFELHRFWCKCMSASDPLELQIDKASNGAQQVSVCLYSSRGCGYGFWTRLKRAVRYLFQLEPEPWFDMIIRNEDLPEIIKILETVRDGTKE